MARALPHESWRKVSPGQAARRGSPATLFDAARREAAAASARRLLGVVPNVQVGVALSPLPATPQTVAELRRGTDPRPWLLSVPTPLAAALADRVLGGEGEGAQAAAIARGDQPLEATAAGALAYLLARLCASLGAGLVLDNFVPAGTVERRIREHGLIATPIAVRVGPAAGQCTLLCPADVEAPGRSARLRPTLASLPVRLSATVARTVLAASDIRMLRRGDVVTLDDWSIDTQGAGSGELRMSGARRALFDVALESSAMRITAVHPREETDMDEATPKPELDDGRALSELTGDAPIEMTVEIAHLSLPLSRVLELEPGDVLETRGRVGGRVALVTAGRTLAIGELVDVEGVLGVRVVELSDTKTGRGGASEP